MWVECDWVKWCNTTGCGIATAHAAATYNDWSMTMTDAEQIKHYKAALKRIATPEAFYVATSDINPEAYSRMIYAEAILDGYTLQAASDKAEYETRQQYPLRSIS